MSKQTYEQIKLFCNVKRDRVLVSLGVTFLYRSKIVVSSAKRISLELGMKLKNPDR